MCLFSLASGQKFKFVLIKTIKKLSYQIIQPIHDWSPLQSEILIFFENTQNCFAYISATKYQLENVLYSKGTAGYLLSPNIKTFAVAFLHAE